MVMHSSTLLGLLLLVATASSMALFESKAVDVPDLPAGEMDDDAQSAVLLFMKLFNPSKPKSRPQRSFQHKTCGQKVLEYTLKICDSLDIKAPPMRVAPIFQSAAHQAYQEDQMVYAAAVQEFETYQMFSRLVLSPENHKINGFVHINNQGQPDVSARRADWNSWAQPGDSIRKCVRCYKQFSEAEPDGECRFHRLGKDCCGNTAPCTTATAHVHNKTCMSEIGKFIKTPRSSGPFDGRSYKVFAIDTEMIYTEYGMEAARATVVDVHGSLVANFFIKPTGRILDLNTQYSGVTEGFLDIAVSLEEAHRILFHHINENTILVGHHLSNDLKVLKLIHTNVVDTAVLFESRGRYPSLKVLAKRHLHKDIHNEVGGHDSTEDASTCIELVYPRIHLLLSSRLALPSGSRRMRRRQPVLSW
ncbi:Protein CBG02435 [Caenorhabditis briggsae]|uniref:Protein CBG02435 n=1 Tax=Caenorhabditis briggsae TaxID=6238 RepID=A8WUB9_CAEBR|nr:Protein CBG02435 [Caenorhabditis briggsae]CAP24081.1 Protein CBG02435 [Caenorhabditis briggsae]